MEGLPKNGNSSLFLGSAAALGIAAVTGVIGWTFAHVFSMSEDIAKINAIQIRQDKQIEQQAHWIDELNQKLDQREAIIQDAINRANVSLETIKTRMDTKNSH